MIDKRTRIECIRDGSWEQLTEWEKTKGMIEFSEGDFESKDFGSLEAFICWYYRERLSEKTSKGEAIV